VGFITTNENQWRECFKILPTQSMIHTYFNVMVWEFCYLRIFKKRHSISGPSLLLNTFLSKTIKNNYIFSSKNANYATLEDKLNVFLSEPVNNVLPKICLLFFFFHKQLIPNKFQYNNILFPKSFYIVL
jgi:hypothetical protein